MSNFSTDAILLKKIEYGDYDFIICFFTKDKGKISVIAKNAKKSIQRFSGALDLFSVNHIFCTLPKKNKEALTILSSADLKEGFVNIRYNFIKTGYASYWAELLYLWLEEEKRQTKLYDLLLSSFDILNQGYVLKEVANLIFQLEFLKISGLSPNFENCKKCKESLDNTKGLKVWFDFLEGYFICEKCDEKKLKYGIRISKGTLKQLGWISKNNIDRTKRMKFSSFIIKEGEKLLELFIMFHIKKDFKSLHFLEQIRQ